MREVCGHDGTPGERSDATLTKPGAFVPNRRRIHAEFRRKKHHYAPAGELGGHHGLAHSLRRRDRRHCRRGDARRIERPLARLHPLDRRRSSLRSRPPGSSRCIGATGAGMAAGIADGAGAAAGIVGAGVRAGVGGRTIIAPGAGAATTATGTASAAAGSAAGVTVTAPGGEARRQACIFATSASEISTLAVTF